MNPSQRHAGDLEIDMASIATASKFSFTKVVIPAGVLILSGLSLFYSLGAGEGTSSTTALPPDSYAKEQPHAADQSGAVAQTRAVVSHLETRPAYRPVPGLTAPSLMSLHKRFADASARQAEDVRLMAEIDHLHQAEPIDAAWSAQAETAVLTTTTQPLMAQSGLKPQDFDTDCHSKTCKISARFAESTDAQSWATMMVTELAGTMSQARVAVTQLPDGSSEVRIYGSRKEAGRG
jgi:hypothetical protein